MAPPPAPRIVSFGKVTRDEMLYLETDIADGGSTRIADACTVYGGMVLWAGRTLRNNGATPVLLGIAGTEVPCEPFGPGSEDRLTRNGAAFHVRVLISPDGQRTFLVDPTDHFPAFHTPEPVLDNVTAAIFDGYSLIPGRNAAEAEHVAVTARQANPGIPIVVTLPVPQLLTGDNVAHLTALFTRIGPITVCGGADEHAAFGTNVPWTTVTTTGSTIPHIDITHDGATSRIPVELNRAPASTLGAGDVFAAGLALALARRYPYETAVRIAHHEAAAHITRRPTRSL